MNICAERPIVISACLLGVNCRYDGKSKPVRELIELFKQGGAVPVCPEQLGGLPTPRTASERKGKQVITRDGADVTDQFNRGAEEALMIAKLAGATTAILTARSPSCGRDRTYDGTFSGTLTNQDGIFAEKCRQNGIKVITHEEI